MDSIRRIGMWAEAHDFMRQKDSHSMEEVVSVMDIDEEEEKQPSIFTSGSNKGKNPQDAKAIPWVEKYRPQTLSDVAAHRDINRLPHLLLYGPPGTGKTSTILAVARKLYGGQYHNMILELNASDDRGIDVVRQQIQDFASTQSFSFGPRCTRFRFAPLYPTHVAQRLKHVIHSEGLDVTESGLAALVRLSNGDMRKALNILQSTHMASQQITEEAVHLCTGNPLPKDIEQIKMSSDVRVQLINDLADIEYRLSFGCNDKLQLGSLIASFTRARSALVAAAK
ncbi:hypothetical protein Tsubulata_039093 [Turnera subulata]|uniref:AAA+ ATPase domain-containing protein n=1 Tax=Turnera subulata TaxID=218843 RepID=A0A9Q0JQU8_9ROSI|nr:hypothetical protein Tsubulata_039093 [Turnera subulata]